MLEAMATGMPVVSVANPTSPVVDGVNGYISDDSHYLQDRIQELLSNRDLAIELGAKGRETVAKEFPISRFVRRWNALFDRVMGQSAKVVAPCKSIRKGRPQVKNRQGEKKNIILSYTSYPASTGAYLEKSLRRQARLPEP